MCSPRTSQWADAKKAFTAGSSALSQMPPLWKQRFTRSAAETALALGDIGGARSWINYALANTANPEDDAQTRLTDAMVSEREGNLGSALASYQELAQSPMDEVAGPAQLHATQLQLTLNTVTPAQAISVFDGLRFRWRGGVVRVGGHPRARPALSLARAAIARRWRRSARPARTCPTCPRRCSCRPTWTAAFKSLFLDGQADGLQPIQALALFYDFKELTPVGEDGDAMVRRLDPPAGRCRPAAAGRGAA